MGIITTRKESGGLIQMKERNEKVQELTKLLAAECGTTEDIASLLKTLFAGTIERMLEAEMAESRIR